MRQSRAVILRASFAGSLIIALSIIPNVFWRNYGFSSGRGFPLTFASWVDYGPPFDSYRPHFLVLNTIVILAMAVGGSVVVARCAEARLQVARSWVFLAAAAPYVFFASHPTPWTTRLQFVVPVLICAWAFLRPSPLPWLLTFLLYASVTLLGYAASILDNNWEGGSPEPVFVCFYGGTWLAFLGVTLYLFHLRPRPAQPTPSLTTE